MISKLSDYITRKLIERRVVLYEEKELYEYGFFMILSYILFLIVSLAFGLIFEIPFLSIIFYAIFCLIRSFAGGVHANSEIKCDILTTLSLFVSIVLIKILTKYDGVWIALVLLLTSSISFCTIKPVGSSQKKISLKEQNYFHIKIILIIAFIVISSIVCIMFGAYDLVISISVSVSLSSILLIVGKLQQKIYLRNTN